ncbi:hypothetical protein [Chitinophaga sp. GbtcB8]|nr:hypothetical protein [Chitinophaga sp. GbtcB8]
MKQIAKEEHHYIICFTSQDIRTGYFSSIQGTMSRDFLPAIAIPANQ